MNKKNILLLVLILFGTISGYADVTMPHIFSDNMLLQREAALKIWGWADKKESVTVTFNGQTVKTKADNNGYWMAVLKPMAHGGPYALTVKGKKNTLNFQNVLIGDVWLASGQSNMEWTVKRTQNADVEIASADYPEIRAFNVKKERSITPQSDLGGSWAVCSSNTVGDFSAVAYFFARKIYNETKIPIGIINSSWGGTIVETWTSGESYTALPSELKGRFANAPKVEFTEEFIQENQKKRDAFLESIKNDIGLSQKWYLPETPISDWKTIIVPGLWSGSLAGEDGIMWHRLDLDLPESVANKAAHLSLGAIDDNDCVWINGVKIGESKGYDIKRAYQIPANVLKSGKNTIVVKVEDTGGGGGFSSSATDLFLEVENSKYSLAGEWKYKMSASSLASGYVDISPNSAASLLYNGMIHPIIQYAIKGAIWYQGESNDSEAYNYRTLFPNLIKDWRKQWGYEFPFYWVQLANYMKPDERPSESNWAELREAQTMTLALPKTGQAVIIDIGEANDIHPRNKQDVGYRLALNALHNDYGFSNLVYSSPMYESVNFENGKAIITFKNIGSGLMVKNKYAYVQGFAIAAAEGDFEWAQAYIDGDKIIVTCDKVKNPIAVRYNWGNNPDGNLYNREGLPVCPFRTDIWKGITEK